MSYVSIPGRSPELVYEAEQYYDDDMLQKLYDYKKQHDICSEEYIYLLAQKYVAITDEHKAEELILELKKSSAQMKKAAQNLEKDLKNARDVMDDEDEWYGEEGWNWLDGQEKQQPYVRSAPKVNRNDPCPCGSGKKYKKCCGRNS